MVFSSTGVAAERFCVRNSGAIAVVEGTSYFKNSILTEIGSRFEIRIEILKFVFSRYWRSWL